jgi:predicted nucleic acid-binding protein
MESVYLETSFISYLVARPSRDVIVAGHQQTTQEWWDNRRSLFECSVSQVVIAEASAGDPTEIQKRLAIISGLPVLKATEEAEALAQAIMAAGMLPPDAVRDAAHVAVAAIHGIDYLLTWNCKHLANAQISRRIRLVCEKLKQRMPALCTPDELMGE